jgi:hypothetical protein
MIRYKVARPFTEFGIHHAVDTIIADVSLIMNLEVKLWDGTLIPVNDEGAPIKIENKKPVEEKKPKQPSNSNPIPEPVATKTTKVTPKVTKSATK